MRVRLVFETSMAISPDGTVDTDLAVDELHALLNEDAAVESIFKEIKILRPFTRKEGVTYGRPKRAKQTDPA